MGTNSSSKIVKIIFLLLLFCSFCFSGCVINRTIEEKPNIREKGRDISELRTKLAIEYFQNRDFRNAVSSIDTAIKADSSYEYAWMVKGIIYQFMKSNIEAENAYKRALSLSSNSAEINNNYGWFICDSLNQPANSIAYFDTALRDPTYPTPYLALMNKGVCKSKAGDYVGGEADLKQLMISYPNYLGSIKAMARLQFSKNNVSYAKSLYETYISQISEPDADDWYLGYEIAKTIGDTKNQKDIFNKIKTQFPFSNEAIKLGSEN